MALSKRIFPIEIAYGSSASSEYKTAIFEARSGTEQRNAVWAQDRFKANVATGIREQKDLNTLLTFFRIVKGQFDTFLFRNYADYTISNETIGTGDGATTQFQITKTYTAGAESFKRNIKWVADAPTSPMIVQVNGNDQALGTDYTLDNDNGVITFTTAPAGGESVVVVYAEFFYLCRFATDTLPIQFEAYRLGSVSSIDILEVK